MKEVTVTEQCTLTGEVSSYTYKKQSLNKGGFCMLYKENMLNLTVLLGHQSDPYSLLLLVYLFNVIPANTNILNINVTTISNKLGIHRKTVAKALAKLEDLQALYIIKEGSNVFLDIMLNPHLRWEGSAEHAKAARDAWERRLNVDLVPRKMKAVK